MRHASASKILYVCCGIIGSFFRYYHALLYAVCVFEVNYGTAQIVYAYELHERAPALTLFYRRRPIRVEILRRIKGP